MERIGEVSFPHFLDSSNAPYPSTSQSNIVSHSLQGNTNQKSMQPQLLHFMNSSAKESKMPINACMNNSGHEKNTPAQYLEIFLDSTVIGWLLNETNNNRLNVKKFQPVKDYEMKCFIAILYLSGYVEVPRRRMLWERSPDTHNHLVVNALQRDRFESIFTALHTNENSDDTNRINQMKPLLKYLNEKFLQYSPTDNHHGIAESNIPCGTRQNQNVKNRTASVWCAAVRSGYCTWFDPVVLNNLNQDPRSVIVNYASTLQKQKADQYNLVFENQYINTTIMSVLQRIGVTGSGVEREKTGCLLNPALGGVDKLDYNMALYKISIRGKRHFSAVITYALDLILHNAWQLYREQNDNKKPIDLLTFRRNIVVYYLQRYCRSPPSQQIGRITKTKKNHFKNNFSEARFDGIRHYVIPQAKQTRCARCSSKTTTRCQKCDIGVHVKCFVEYHKRSKDTQYE